MQHVPPPDSFRLRAAIGWMELGAGGEALAELNAISPEFREHPDSLEVRWEVLAHARDWDAAAETAGRLIQRAPDRASGWLHRAYAIRRMASGGLDAALRALLPAVDTIPDEPVIAFNLACYACQLDRLDEARRWLDRALKVGRKSEIKSMALADEDLKALWPEIDQL